MLFFTVKSLMYFGVTCNMIYPQTLNFSTHQKFESDEFIIMFRDMKQIRISALFWRNADLQIVVGMIGELLLKLLIKSYMKHSQICPKRNLPSSVQSEWFQ